MAKSKYSDKGVLSSFFGLGDNEIIFEYCQKGYRGMLPDGGWIGLPKSIVENDHTIFKRVSGGLENNPLIKLAEAIDKRNIDDDDEELDDFVFVNVRDLIRGVRQLVYRIEKLESERV